MTALVKLQRSLKQLIVAPNGVAAALAELGEPAARALEQSVSSDTRSSAVERLDVYANAYFYRIRDCLESDFGALRAVLGADRFHNLATGYLIEFPPRHPSLRFVGDRIAEFIDGHSEVGPEWLADLARLEWAIVEAFDAADANVVSRDELAAIDPVDWAELRFAFQPALTRLDLGFPVHRVRLAWDNDDPVATAVSQLAALDRGMHPMLVWRTDERVSYRSLDPVEATAVDFALSGGAFGALCEQLASALGDGEASNHAAALLARWQADGLIRGLSTMPPTPNATYP